MSYTLLKMVQLILSSMDGDEINSISDTTESQQIVDIIEQTYNDIATTIDFPDEWNFFELEAGSAAQPTYLKLPDNVGKLEWVKYDFSDTSATVRNWVNCQPIHRTEFFDRMQSLDSSVSNVYAYNITVGTGSFDVRGYNDKQPVYYTTVDDKHLIFDNFDISKDQLLVSNKFRCYGNLIPVFTREDNFIPDLEPKQFTLLLNEAKSQAWVDLRQTVNAKADQRAKRGWMQAHRKAPQLPNGEIKSWKPDYGRRGSSPHGSILDIK